MYGENWREKKEDNFKGLIPKLSQRIGLLKKIRKRMPEDTFKMISLGLFTSLVTYCIEVFRNNWGLDTMDETERRSILFTKKDSTKLQVLQNTVLKLQTGLQRDYPTKDLLSKIGNLSIHQLIAYQILVQVFKVINNQKPFYI